MAINLKNYTSDVPAATSMSRIEQYLVAAGATDISKKYEDQVCIAIQFRMMIELKPVFFKLPARVDACFKVLWAEVKRPQPSTKEKTMQQAEKTAWKIICDWVQVQMSMIQLEQAELLQVFLPYVMNPHTEETFYNTIKTGGFKLL